MAAVVITFSVMKSNSICLENLDFKYQLWSKMFLIVNKLKDQQAADKHCKSGP